MNSPKAMSKKPIWKWWYSGCLVQQIYVVLAVLSGILVAGVAILLSSSKIRNEQDPKTADLINKYKNEIVVALLLSFVVTFVVDNLILVQYCNMGIRGGMNLLWSLILWFVVLPIINGVISYVFMTAIAGQFLKEMK